MFWPHRQSLYQYWLPDFLPCLLGVLGDFFPTAAGGILGRTLRLASQDWKIFYLTYSPSYVTYWFKGFAL